MTMLKTYASDMGKKGLIKHSTEMDSWKGQEKIIDMEDKEDPKSL